MLCTHLSRRLKPRHRKSPVRRPLAQDWASALDVERRGKSLRKMKPLRVCIECGLEAHTEEDLELFAVKQDMLHGRRNICKACWRTYQNKRYDDSREALLARFRAMKARCYNKKARSYPNYGDRGITICGEWLSNPEAFVSWALANGFMRGLQIDRIDNNRPYHPDNCRWVTNAENSRNRRR